MTSKERAQKILDTFDIEINGSNPWDVQVHDERLYDRVFSGGSLALGESYMDGWWDVDDMPGFFFRIFRNVPSHVLGVGVIGHILKAKFFNLQSVARAFQVAEHHYDLDNDLYEKMLDKRMVYTCGYWKNATTLDEAQENKLDLVCRKIGLKKGDTVLDIGCGWGGFAKFAAEKYGAKVVGINVSKEQVALARERTKGLPVEFRLQDWRGLGKEMFNHVVAIGVLEHIGTKNYREFMLKVRSVLSNDGLFLVHTVGHSKSTRSFDPWFNKYIFPNSRLPSVAHIGAAIDRRWFGESTFVLEDWHNFGSDYDTTLLAWFANFDRAWPELKKKYDERFYRMWKYYLLLCAGMIRARYLHLWQIVLSPKGVVGGYTSVR